SRVDRRVGSRKSSARHSSQKAVWWRLRLRERELSSITCNRDLSAATAWRKATFRRLIPRIRDDLPADSSQRSQNSLIARHVPRRNNGVRGVDEKVTRKAPAGPGAAHCAAR